eukprot:gnl/TRDRNA2_/TRDRNA2_165742_c1_seq2.p1 gnl/TRDRNA2_/TRDRNA2_165742_c1~~gnl/TRDRNA2_/TRDRNA2_165742_c1_seq2.p1  ORF type:complete len:168 (-),score=11.69 gnl/TRDRNA2_/TRDRNA2_165742_c1_seq2:393-896(-)
MELVPVGDARARGLNVRTKFIEQRKEQPLFEVVIDILQSGWRIDDDVAWSVDDFLCGCDDGRRGLNRKASLAVNQDDGIPNTGSTTESSQNMLHPGLGTILLDDWQSSRVEMLTCVVSMGALDLTQVPLRAFFAFLLMVGRLSLCTILTGLCDCNRVRWIGHCMWAW